MDVAMDVSRSAPADDPALQLSGGRTTPATPRIWRPSSTELKVRASTSLFLLDGAVVLFSFGLAAAVRGMLLSDVSWLLYAGLLLPLFAVASINLRAYSTTVMEEPFFAIKKGEQALLTAIASLTLLNFYLKSSQVFPRLTIALGSVCALVLLAVARYLFVRHLPAIVGGNPFHAILIRDCDSSIDASRFSEVLGRDWFDPESHDPVAYDRLAKTLSPADRVVVSCPPERRAAWARALQGANIQGEIVVPELARLSPLGLGPDRENPSVIVTTGPLTLNQRGQKRLFDVAVASAAVLFLSPVFAIIAVMIKLDSPGSVLFRQTRIGRGNQMFQMLKFRSMRASEVDVAGHRSTSRKDDRITRVGRWIRKTSLDELPQLLNVLRGEMSIVGPRPHALGSRAADKLFWEVDQNYWNRHATKPGLTGLAQVRGFRGATLQEDDLRNRLRADLEYLENWSIWRDVKIIALTVRVLLHQNAY